MMDNELGGMLTAVYSQYWPANLPKKQKLAWNVDGRFERQVERRNCVRGYDGVQRELVGSKSGSSSHRECWSGEPNQQHQHQQQQQQQQIEGKEPIFDTALDALTKAEFKRLKEQIRDVSASLGYKFRGSGYKNYVQKEENNPVLYRSQLADSMRTFRLQTRPPLQPESRKVEFTRCRPIIGTKPICTRPQTAPPMYHTQPHSQRPQSALPANEVAKPAPTYDSLTSDYIFNLADKARIDSGYGDREQYSGDEGDSSDDENIPEPEVDENRQIPEFPALRPDTLENMYMSEGERDYEKYDFDASKNELPKYEFKYSGPDEFEKVDFEDLASYGKDWRLMTKRRPQDPEMEVLIDKLIELERLVAKTSDWEDRRREKCRHLMKQKLITVNNLRAQGRRVSSARTRDRKCCTGCLQAACTGDCPLKKTSINFCLHCRQEFCSGHCVHLSYNSHSRMTASESDSDSEPVTKAPRARPKSCQSCRRTDTNTKVINTNQILQGRPKSSLSTFNRGKSSLEARELIPEDHECHNVIEEEFTKLNIVPNSRPSTATKRPPRGRAALVPGKSYFSQRHDSITIPKAERVKSAPPRLGAGARVKRVRSARGRRSRQGSRPGTAGKGRLPEDGEGTSGVM